ncbi:MAG TPA: glycosyltransferase family 39 protein [Thermoleophilaceae bacterium]
MRARSVQVVAALTVLAAILRFATLDVQSFWFDEAVTVQLLKGSFGHMLSSIGGSESTPPLYYAIAWVWSRVFGDGEVGLRSLSALAGTLFVPVAYAAGRELASRKVATVIAVLAAVNPLLIWYSQEARSYSLLVLFAGLSFWFFVRQAHEERDRTLVFWTLASALAIATHYFAAFVVAPEAAWLLLRSRDRRRPALAVAALLAVGAALLPLLLRQRKLDLTSFITQSSLWRRVLEAAKQFVVGYSSPAQVVVVVLAACLVVVALGLVYARLVENERRAAGLAALVGLTGVGVPLILAIAGADYFDTRNLLAAWLPLMLVLAVGLGSRRAGRTGLVATLGLCAVGLFVSIAVWANPAYQREDDRGLAHALGPATVPRALVVTPNASRVPLGLYSKPGLGTRPIPVREVDLLALPIRSSVFSGAKPPPRAPNHPPPAPGMKLVEQRFTRRYTLIRFRSPTPVLLQPATLLALRLDPRVAAVLYQR